MRAAKTSSGWWHWCHPDGMAALCGRQLIGMNIERELDLDHIPADGRQCVPCEAVRQEGGFLDSHVTLPPSYGTVRKTGPLSHGTHSYGLGGHRQGQRLQRHDG